MSETNKQTLDSYNEHLQEYIDGTPHEVSGGQKEWIDTALELLPQNAEILEVGSGFGRDADYIESRGFSVHKTDASKSFVDYLNQNGKNAEVFNIVTDDIKGEFDMIFASAVLLHLTPDELAIALEKTHHALKDNGILAFSVKKGEGSEWSQAKLGAPRFFQYWEFDSLAETLKNNSFGVIWHSDDPSGHNKDDSTKWLHIIAKSN